MAVEPDDDVPRAARGARARQRVGRRRENIDAIGLVLSRELLREIAGRHAAARGEASAESAAAARSGHRARRSARITSRARFRASRRRWSVRTSSSMRPTPSSIHDDAAVRDVALGALARVAHRMCRSVTAERHARAARRHARVREAGRGAPTRLMVMFRPRDRGGRRGGQFGARLQVRRISAPRPRSGGSRLFARARGVEIFNVTFIAWYQTYCCCDPRYRRRWRVDRRRRFDSRDARARARETWAHGRSRVVDHGACSQWSARRPGLAGKVKGCEGRLRARVFDARIVVPTSEFLGRAGNACAAAPVSRARPSLESKERGAPVLTGAVLLILLFQGSTAFTARAARAHGAGRRGVSEDAAARAAASAAASAGERPPRRRSF